MIGGIIAFFVFLHIAFLPSVVPFFLFALYGFWVPQIYRNALRGTIGAFDHTFIFGTSIARLGLPLCKSSFSEIYGRWWLTSDIFACPDNIFFVNLSNWVLVLPVWLAAQIGMLLAQERFGPAFLYVPSFPLSLTLLTISLPARVHPLFLLAHLPKLTTSFNQQIHTIIIPYSTLNHPQTQTTTQKLKHHYRLKRKHVQSVWKKLILPPDLLPRYY